MNNEAKSQNINKLNPAIYKKHNTVKPNQGYLKNQFTLNIKNQIIQYINTKGESLYDNEKLSPTKALFKQNKKQNSW